MHTALLRWLRHQSTHAATKGSHRRLVDGVLHLDQGTTLVPQPYKQFLLDQFVRGNLTIDQGITHLEVGEHE